LTCIKDERGLLAARLALSSRHLLSDDDIES
jgi:hypothetical protein